MIAVGTARLIRTRRTHLRTQQKKTQHLTKNWGSARAVSLYLDRCRVDTPFNVISRLWFQVNKLRPRIKKVVDFGAGDGRFAATGEFERYVGFEIDLDRCLAARLPERAKMMNQCAFSDEIKDADLCLGNPPYVRNQDLPSGWRRRVAGTLFKRTGVAISGLANAWQYFFLLGLASTKPDGLVALIVPFEWVSRPSSLRLREYIKHQRWDVDVYRLRDDTFSRVLTTSSITIVDKRGSKGQWRYFAETRPGVYSRLASPTGGSEGVIDYAPRELSENGTGRVKRGLSPGTQSVLTLTEGERVRLGLKIRSDVVPCVTSLRQLKTDCTVLTDDVFEKHFRLAGLKCWLIRTNRPPTRRLKAYLDSVPKEKYQTSTCLSREKWWEFSMPEIPCILIASGFRCTRPKAVLNNVGAVAVGSVYGLYGLAARRSKQVLEAFKSVDLSGSIVMHSNGLRKVEVNQMNTLFKSLGDQAS
jgi:hypothetical protein